MAWHVQFGFHIDVIRTRSSFRYRTTNGFLQKYGGNLKTLFNKHFPLTIKSEVASSKLLDALSKKGNFIKSMIPNWYNYAVGTGSISDKSMYSPYGNRIHFRNPHRSFSYLNYGQEYRFSPSHTRVMTATKAPFTLVSTILNENQLDSYYELEVASYRQNIDTGEVISQFENSTTLGTYFLQYKAIHFFHPSYKTTCEMYFLASNPQVWNSVAPSSFRLYSSTSRSTSYRIEGNPSNVLFGYILLASQTGYNMTSEELNKVANIILQIIATTTNVFSEKAPSNNDTLVVPVAFDKGTTEEMMSTVPPTYRRYVEPGYLQFRAYNLTGYPNAVCPGVKTGVISPEYLCIGGVSGNVEQHGTCGDFAGWGGTSPDKLLSSQPSGSAHSRKDILSTILIFYR